MRHALILTCLFLFLCPLQHASAHYLWVTINQQHGEHGATNIYFEGGPSPGDGKYLDHFTDTKKTWLRTVESSEPQLIETDDVRDGDKRWLQAKLAKPGPRSIDCYAKFGVYNYGKTRVLLHYYGRNLDVTTDEQLHKLGRAKQMNLELVPHGHDENFDLRVLWKGEPAAKRTVHIRGPNNFKENLTTDDKGRVKFTASEAGRYTFRTSVEEATSGKDGEDEYDLIRHQGTLIMTLPLQD